MVSAEVKYPTTDGLIEVMFRVVLPAREHYDDWDYTDEASELMSVEGQLEFVDTVEPYEPSDGETKVWALCSDGEVRFIDRTEVEE